MGRKIAMAVAVSGAIAALMRMAGRWHRGQAVNKDLRRQLEVLRCQALSRFVAGAGFTRQ